MSDVQSDAGSSAAVAEDGEPVIPTKKKKAPKAKGPEIGLAEQLEAAAKNLRAKEGELSGREVTVLTPFVERVGRLADR